MLKTCCFSCQHTHLDNYGFYSIFDNENKCMLKNICEDFYLFYSLNLA